MANNRDGNVSVFPIEITKNATQYHRANHVEDGAITKM